MKALDDGAVVIASEPLADLCNNSFQSVSIGVGDVSSLEIDLPSSGAVVRIHSCECSVNPIKLTFGRKQVRWVLKNVGADPVTIDQVSIEWPPINGNLKKIKLGQNTIWTGNLPPLSATTRTPASTRARSRVAATPSSGPGSRIATTATSSTATAATTCAWTNRRQ